MNEVLDSILLSDNVVKNFHNGYEDESFKSWILGLLPEVEKCLNTKQDNPWHIYNCLDHILNSVQQMNMQTQGLDDSERRLLAYTMFLHDIGKPECFFRRFAKSYGREVDSFFNHNKAGVKVAQRVLPDFDFNNDDIEKICLLIHDHDVFMNLSLERVAGKKQLTNEVVDKMIEKYNQFGDGVKLLRQLIKVGRADNLSQNPEMTKGSLLLLDGMEVMVKDSYPDLDVE